MKISVFDERLSILTETADFAREKLSSQNGTTVLRKRDLIPDKYTGNEKLSTGFADLLYYFDMSRQRNLKSVKKAGIDVFKRRLQILNLVFWRLTSEYYPWGKSASISKKVIKELCATYGLVDLNHDDIYASLIRCLQIVGFTSGVANRAGGIELILPTHLPGRTETDLASNVVSFTPEWNVTDEYSLYNKENSRLVEFIKKHILDGKSPGYTDWRTFRDTRGRPPVVSTEEQPDRGKWQNPDILCYRVNKYSKDVEVYAFEVKIKFEKEAIAAAQWYQSFSNFSYVAIASDVKEVLKRKNFFRHLSERGIGILALRQPENLRTWFELLPAQYKTCRRVKQIFILGSYQKASKKHIEKRSPSVSKAN